MQHVQICWVGKQFDLINSVEDVRQAKLILVDNFYIETQAHLAKLNGFAKKLSTLKAHVPDRGGDAIESLIDVCRRRIWSLPTYIFFEFLHFLSFHFGDSFELLFGIL